MQTLSDPDLGPQHCLASTEGFPHSQKYPLIIVSQIKTISDKFVSEGSRMIVPKEEKLRALEHFPFKLKKQFPT